MTHESGITRRLFLQVSFTTTGALLVGAGCTSNRRSARPPASSPALTGQPSPTVSGGSFQPNLFVRVDQEGKVTLTVHRSEMGQGVRTALAMILAEELDVDWSAVHVEQSPANKAIGQQLTSGSGSITNSYDFLRQAGATARQFLVAAAAKAWAVPAGQLRTEHGTVVLGSTAERRSYGSLVSVARDLKVASAPVLKNPADFKLIGTSIGRVDEPAIVRGTATYGLDVRVPNLGFAVVARCPVSGGKLAGFDPAPAKAVAGVRSVVQISNGVAVVADTTWAAIKGRAALKVSWNEGDRASLSSEGIRQSMLSGLRPAIDAQGPAPAPGLQAFFETPYLAHAPMEPLSCVADVRPDRCEVWAPTQNPQDVQSFVEDAVGRPATVHVTNIGGGFGRRLEVDFTVEAAEVSKAVGMPIQVTWTREDDIQHDYYRPPTLHWMRAGWGASAMPIVWRHLIAGPGLNGVVYQVGVELLQDGLEVPYRISDSDSKATLINIPLPTGPWRAVMDGPNAFANECFIDEVASAIHRDPLELRLALMDPTDLMRPVVALAAAKAGWGLPLAPGRGRGIACHQRADTPVAMVVEASTTAGAVQVHRVVCALDCGTVINPDMVVQQIEGGVVYALTAMLHGTITFDRGRVQQSNFHDYPLLQLAEMPAVEVHIVPSTRPPKGVGEMGVPPLAPAVANALHAVTGKRIRRLPVQASDL